MAIRYMALVLAIVLVGSILVSGFAVAKTPASGTTHKIQIKVLKPHNVAKTPNPATKAVASKPNTNVKAATKMTAKPTAVKRKP